MTLGIDAADHDDLTPTEKHPLDDDQTRIVRCLALEVIGGFGENPDHIKKHFFEGIVRPGSGIWVEGMASRQVRINSGFHGALAVYSDNQRVSEQVLYVGDSILEIEVDAIYHFCDVYGVGKPDLERLLMVRPAKESVHPSRANRVPTSIQLREGAEINMTHYPSVAKLALQSLGIYGALDIRNLSYPDLSELMRKVECIILGLNPGDIVKSAEDTLGERQVAFKGNVVAHPYLSDSTKTTLQELFENYETQIKVELERFKRETRKS